MKCKECITKMYQIIDDIDTISDIAKSNNEAYRLMVENKIKMLRLIPIGCDGYTLDLSKISCDLSQIKKDK